MSVDELRDELDEHQEDIEQDEATETEAELDDDEDAEPDEPDDSQDDNQDDDPADELGFSFDDSDESDPYAGQPAPEWVKQVRKENRKLKRQLREQQSQQQPVLREKPTLEQFDYDQDAFEQSLLKWHEEKRQVEEQEKAERAKYQQYDDRYKQSVNAVRAKASDYDDIEEDVVNTLSVSKQALIKTMADEPAKLVYNLGKSPNKLAELAGLDDIQFAKQVVLLEQRMTQRKSRNPAKPKPKTHELSGGAGGGDAKLAKLEAEAERTGDRSKVISYKRQLKNKS